MAQPKRKRAAELLRVATTIALIVYLQSFIRAQTPTPLATTPSSLSASLSGFVLDELNHPVQATVTIATQGLRQSALSGPDGSFTFSNLKTGMFVACAVPPPTTTGRRFVDSCLWQDRNSVQVPLAPGQALQGVIVPVQDGYPLDIRVNDPAGLLPVPVGNVGANELAIHIISPSGLAHPVPIASKDAKGRDHVLVVPYNTPLQLLIHSSSFVLKDANGNDLAATTKISFTVTQNGPAISFTVNVDRPAP
jgi:hypothetical protein